MPRSLREVARIAIASPLALAALCCAAGEVGGTSEPATERDPYESARRQMVSRQIEARGIRDEAVLDALREVPRHLFVPESIRRHAYEDRPLPIGLRQTISQPYIVALMTELIRPTADMKVLEVGTGSGYQAAVLGKLTKEVYTIEILPQLAERSSELLERLDYSNIHVRAGDGFDGWPDQAPFDAVVVTAAPKTIPRPLLEQLAVGGRLVIPVGSGSQDLVLVERTEDGFRKQSVTPVRFVPMTGKAQEGP